MTSGQRKAHKISWILIAILGIIFLFFTLRGLNFDKKGSKDVNEVELTIQDSSWD